MSIGVKSKLESEALLKVSRMKPVIKPTIPHRHAGYHELIFLSKGAGSHTIGDEKFDVTPNTGYYLGLSEVHCWDFSKIPDGYVILFKEEVLSQYPNAVNSLFQLTKTFEIADTEQQIFAQLETFQKEYKKGSSLHVLAAHLNLLILTTLNLPSSSPKLDSTVIDQLALFKRLINEHFAQLKNVQEYADLMKISVRKLNTICKTTLHTNAREVIKERILIEAKNLLTHTNNQVTEIAYSLNFTDSSNFVKFFKQQTNLTPLEYRSKIKV
ncbi:MULTISPECIES: AraC family transcriptional regulator [Algoriphagus]|nr:MULTISPECIES: AraC family transcriptional regulator [Algoriphagus]TXD75961.1 helix-turn-helix domain-containing protein [Algoriphagus ratkowskyi]|tara:strand:- start:11547 stop:12353 length:807 start_codon:yes stop_codon:yes gene_type:complete